MARPKKFSDSEILKKSFRVISHEGFESFTLAQVARATQLSPAALIKRFGSKARLATLARDQRWADTLATTQGAAAVGSGLAGIFSLVELIARNVDSKRLGEHLRLLAAQALDPKARRRVAASFATTREILARHLAEANIAKSEELAVTLEALIQGTIFQYGFLLTDTISIEAHLKQQVATFLELASRTGDHQ